MSTVKSPGVEFDFGGIGLRSSGRRLTGHIHHYWDNCKELRQRESDRERGREREGEEKEE